MIKFLVERSLQLLPLGGQGYIDGNDYRFAGRELDDLGAGDDIVGQNSFQIIVSNLEYTLVGNLKSDPFFFGPLPMGDVKLEFAF